jgi:hypothetical protein
MLTSHPTQNPESQRRPGLAHVLVLLMSLDEEKEPVYVQAVGGEKETTIEILHKDNTRASLPSPGK